MTNRWLMAVARIALAGLCAIALAGSALAQEDDSDVEPGADQTSAARRDLMAIVKAEAPTTGDRSELAAFYHRRGHANQRLGNYAQAIEDLRAALERSSPQAPDGWGARYRIQNDLGNSYENRGDRFAAIDHWQAVAREYQGSNQFHYHSAQLKLMDSYGVLAQWGLAEAARKEADATFARLRNRPKWSENEFAATNMNARLVGTYFRRQGNHAEAERRFRLALDHAEKNLELRRRTFGAGHQTLRASSQALSSAKRLLADSLATQGKYGEAEIIARLALRDTIALYEPNTTQVSGALAALGWIRFQQGDVSGSENRFRAALKAIEGSGVAAYSTTLASRRAELGNVEVAKRRWEDAVRIFEVRDEGLRADAAQFKRTGSNHISWALALLKSGQAPRAAEMAGRMVASQLKRPVPDRWALAQRRGVLAMALGANGRTAEALKAFQQTVPDLVRRDQEGTGEESTGFWKVYWQRAILEGYLELLAGLHAAGEQVPGLDLVEESFRIADIARASGVQEAINATAARAQIPDPNLAALARKEQDTLNRVMALSQLLVRLAAAPEEQRLNKVIADMRGEIERLRKEHAALRADIRKRYPEYAELIDPRPASLADVRKAFAPGEALISIFLGDAQSYVWTAGPGGNAVFRVVPLKREEVERDVRELRRAVDVGDGNLSRLRPFDLARSHRIYRAFLEADEGLWKDAQTLNVIPHGALGELPFALLVTSAPAAGGETPWLLRKVAIAQLPSASAFTALRRAPAGKAQRQPFIGFGDPLFAADAGGRAGTVRNLTLRTVADAPEVPTKGGAGGAGEGAAGSGALTLARAFSLMNPLPDTSDELREIAAVLKADPARDVFVNRQATEKNVKQAGLHNRRVVAFATHGIAPGEITGLDQPALVLSNPALTGDADNDGFLTMEEVLALKLDADWVVLSACNTASADGRGSEAVSGLGRAFFYAGARSLLVSNWAVETTSARLLTTELFRRQSENPQLTRAEALRQSMLDLMGKKGPGGFSYSHPVFWAPFSLVGDGGR